MDASATAALTALRRFGLGPRPDDLAHLASDPRGALLEELTRPQVILIEKEELRPSYELVAAFELEDRRRFEKRKLRDLAGLQQSAMAASMSSAGDAASPMLNAAVDGMTREPAPPHPTLSLKPPFFSENVTYQREMDARLEHQSSLPIGFAERLAMFWSNHFCIAVNDGWIRSTAGAFEREAIRPHVTGRFGEMLRAVEKHPAMLIYLNNRNSTGPASPVGQKRNRGLNENLAREILELHTLGVEGGYTQADVTMLARIITGWTLIPARIGDAHSGRFRFDPNMHEPGDHALLGQTFPDTGLAQGEAALDMLARHPSTARHIARKLATHFVADTPPPALVERLERTFLDTDGDLAALARVLVEAPEAWEPQPRKLRTPQEFIIAARRLTGQPGDPVEAANLMLVLGQQMWKPVGPDGFPDEAGHWLSTNGMKTRLDIAEMLARNCEGMDPMAMADQAFGNAASAETRQAVRRAESRAQGIALLLMSPEFQRR